MAGFSEYTANAVLNHVLGVAPFPFPTPYLALLLGADGPEVTGGGYKRIPLFGAFRSALNGVTVNHDDLEASVATSRWGTITHVAVTDKPSKGHYLTDPTTLEQPVVIDTGDIFRIPRGGLEQMLMGRASTT
jgi:hypothetical protein